MDGRVFPPRPPHPFCLFPFRGATKVPPDVVPPEFVLGGCQQDGGLADVVFVHDLAELVHDVLGHLAGFVVVVVVVVLPPLDVLVGLGQHDDVGDTGREVFAHLFHDVGVLVDGPVPRVDEVEDDPEVFALFQVLAREGRPPLLLLVGDLCESKAGQVHQIKAVVVLFSLHGVAVAEFLFSPRFVVNGEEIELLRLSRRLAGVGERLAVGDHVDQARLADVGPPDEGGLSPVRRREPGRVDGTGHEEDPPHQAVRQRLVDRVVVVRGEGAHGAEDAVRQVAGELHPRRESLAGHDAALPPPGLALRRSRQEAQPRHVEFLGAQVAGRRSHFSQHLQRQDGHGGLGFEEVPRGHGRQGPRPVLDSLAALVRVEVASLHRQRQLVGDHVQRVRDVVDPQEAPDERRRFHRLHRRPVLQLADLDRPPRHLVVLPAQGRNGQPRQEGSPVAVGKADVALVDEKTRDHPQVVVVVHFLGPLDGLDDVVGGGRGREPRDRRGMQRVVFLSVVFAFVSVSVVVLLGSLQRLAFRSRKLAFSLRLGIGRRRGRCRDRGVFCRGGGCGCLFFPDL
mmetsp:Transcript_13859/g.31985  ORF Transcript_13859/g.31985 Transcript_13859/m.31985 type:complete len:566 (+) Transcript_13859:4578-6275(+)